MDPRMAGRGLGLAGAIAGTPGINPAAPDYRLPAGGDGLGLAQPEPSPRPQAGDPSDLRDLPLLQRIALGAGAVLTGSTAQIDQLRAQRQALAEQKRQHFGEALELLGKFGAVLERTPHRQYGTVREGLRARAEEIEPGIGEYFDLLVPETSDAVGRLGAAAEDPAIQVVLQNPDWTDADLQKVLVSPEFSQRALQRQDQTALPVVREKIQTALRTTDPRLRELLSEAMGDDRKLTLDEYRDLEDELPENLRLTPGELGSARRNEESLIDLPGLALRAETLAARAARAKTDEEIRRDEAQHANRLEEIRLEASLRPKPSGAGGEASLPQITGLRGQYQRHTKAAFTLIDASRKVREALAKGGGVGDIAALYAIIKSLDPESVVREGEINLAQSSVSRFHRLQFLVDKVATDQSLTAQQRKEMLELSSDLERQVSEIQRDYEKNVRGLAARHGIVPEDIITRSVESGGAEPATTGDPGRAAAIRAELERRRKAKP